MQLLRNLIGMEIFIFQIARKFDLKKENNKVT